MKYKYINLKGDHPEYPEGFQVINKYDFYHEMADPILIYRDKEASIAREYSEDKWTTDGTALQIKHTAYVQQPDSNGNLLPTLNLLDLFFF